MPHLSKHPLKEVARRKLDEKFSYLLAESGTKRKRIIRELLTETERTMLTKRLGIIFLVSRNVATHRISELLRVSPSTVARFEKKVASGMYNDICLWLNTKNTGFSILQMLIDVALVPLDVQYPHRMRKRRTQEYTR